MEQSSDFTESTRTTSEGLRTTSFCSSLLQNPHLDRPTSPLPLKQGVAQNDTSSDLSDVPLSQPSGNHDSNNKWYEGEYLIKCKWEFILFFDLQWKIVISPLANHNIVSTSLATKSDGTQSYNPKGHTTRTKFIATERTNSRSSGLEVICEKTSTWFCIHIFLYYR